MKIRRLMNNEELKNDNLWYQIMDSYIPDDYTTIKIRQTADMSMVILAVSYVENYRNNLNVYYGNNFYEAFRNSGYLEGLLEQDNEYFELMFSDEQIELIRKEIESYENRNKIDHPELAD